ncbi:hypothetical protein SEA_BEE17_2 [Microbacterium phage Bee17]|nr:hypothetical protein SEA_BEE17_2 [Microbacterium phage Bee17]
MNSEHVWMYYVQVLRLHGWIDMHRSTNRDTALNYLEMLQRRERDAIIRVRKYSN